MIVLVVVSALVAVLFAATGAAELAGAVAFHARTGDLVATSAPALVFGLAAAVCLALFVIEAAS
ncbi:hypothetical protein [Nocardia shimofusensis]|uniref:hypothetical protein n=1 Tax=Nocardia shimofusensis TaxID=228596 RepID=UPI00082BC309|nr:hypothetical protein [Nocardia shimofusensis]